MNLTSVLAIRTPMETVCNLAMECESIYGRDCLYSLLDSQSQIRKDKGSMRLCALCSKSLDLDKVVALCDDCLKIADCCVGLEKVSETE